MQRFRSKLIIGLIRNRHLFRFRLKREVVDENFSVEHFRAGIDRSSARIKLPADIRIEPVTISSLYSEWIIPENASEENILLYIHGGGFISGSCLTHRMHVAKFARECSTRSLLFDYRLAPEHPFPAALEDCLAVYKYLLEKGHSPGNIIVGGESAGASLTLSLLHLLKKDMLPMPRAAFAISPLGDVRCMAPSFEYNARKDIAPYNSWKVWTEMYAADHDPKDPLLSPLLGDFSGFPPLHICVGSYEIHLDDCRNIAEKAKNDGVEIHFREWPGMVHAFPLLTPMFPEATLAFHEICTFVKAQLSNEIHSHEIPA